jgi:SNF2 family DNA or RNA helicase
MSGECSEVNEKEKFAYELMDRFRDDDAVKVFISTDAGGVGLNLQSGSALINMDVPWNPAVLEQRNARIHRLGQKRSVQIITLMKSKYSHL